MTVTRKAEQFVRKSPSWKHGNSFVLVSFLGTVSIKHFLSVMANFLRRALENAKNLLDDAIHVVLLRCGADLIPLYSGTSPDAFSECKDLVGT